MHALSKEIEHICINKICPYISSQTRSIHHNYQANHVCTLLTLTSPIFGGWENLTSGDQ